MREVAVHCGSNPELIGIYTQANNNKTSNNHPVTIFVNSGLLPSTGPFRLYVRLARHFAKLGFDSFRFDLSGIGESERSHSGLSRDKQQIKDISDVMDSLETSHQKNRFVVVGICTGADNAHRAMVTDSRVIGCICVDGYFYKTKRFYFNYVLKNLAPGLLKRIRWQKKYSQKKELIQNYLRKITDKTHNHSIESATVPYRWEVPPKTQTASEYQTFIDNNQNTLCIFTASWPYNYLSQHADAFPDIEFGNHIQVQYFENVAHIFPLAEGRKVLTECMSAWLIERFSKN